MRLRRHDYIYIYESRLISCYDMTMTMSVSMTTSMSEFLPRHPPLPIVWEQRCPACDSMFVETNLIVAALLDSHSNSSAEEYTVNYMIKEGAGLKCATSMMLTAMDHIARHPSSSVVRTGTHLAMRTVNSLVGGHCD